MTVDSQPTEPECGEAAEATDRHDGVYEDWLSVCTEREWLESRLREVEAERDKAIRNQWTGAPPNGWACAANPYYKPPTR